MATPKRANKTDKVTRVLTELGEMARGLTAPKGQKNLSMAISYAAAPTSVGDSAGKELAQSLLRLGPLPGLNAGMVNTIGSLSQIPGGPVLFKSLIEAPGYYPLFAEDAIVKFYLERLREIVQNSCIVEFGVGDGSKTCEFFRTLGVWPQRYIGIDISQGNLELAKQELCRGMPADRIEMIEADFFKPGFWPRIGKKLKGLDIPTVGFIPGSTLGNFTLSQVTTFLAQARRELDQMLLAFDSTQNKSLIEGAYGEKVAPVALQFHLSGLVQAARHIDIINPDDFILSYAEVLRGEAQQKLMKLSFLIAGIDKKFSYDMKYRPDAQAVDIGLISLEEQTYFSLPEDEGAIFALSGWSSTARFVTFKNRERIHCVNSHKWDVATLGDVFRQTGWQIAQRMSFAESIGNPEIVATVPADFRTNGRAHKIDYNIFHLLGKPAA